MKIGVVGGGISGMTAAYRLAQQGHKIIIYEKSETPGGLATGFKEKNWEWSLEHHYHHIFTSDHHIRKLAKELKSFLSESGAMMPVDRKTGKAVPYSKMKKDKFE